MYLQEEWAAAKEPQRRAKSTDPPMYLQEEWAAAKETISPKHVVCLVTDGEPSNRAARAVLEGLYPRITMPFCMAHCLNLLKDICHLSWISPYIADAAKIVTFINNHNLLFVLSS
ncbi:hypothetical protein L7F22_002778 [Adiantum nelumboides]|nr:hypothetical protein [Adiantum nelumboides]